MGWDVLAALGRFLRAAVAHYGVYEEAEEGQTAHTLETGSSNGRGIIHLQYDDAEANTDLVCSSSNCRKVEDQRAAPETCLEAVHREESAWFQGISEE
jgi:hypothetical protein